MYNLQPFPSPCSKNTNIRHAQIALIMFHRKFSRLFLKEWNWMLTKPFTKISSERQELSTTSKMQCISEKYGSRLSLYKNIRPMPPQESLWWGPLWRWSRKVSGETYLSNQIHTLIFPVRSRLTPLSPPNFFSLSLSPSCGQGTAWEWFRDKIPASLRSVVNFLSVMETGFHSTFLPKNKVKLPGQ